MSKTQTAPALTVHSQPVKGAGIFSETCCFLRQGPMSRSEAATLIWGHFDEALKTKLSSLLSVL